MPSALLLDLDDTLLDDRGAMAKSVLQLRSKHRIALRESDDAIVNRWDEVGRALWRRMSLGEISIQEQRRARLRSAFQCVLTDGEADALFGDYLVFYEGNWSLLPGAEAFLLATKHLPRAIVTNGHQPQVDRKLARCGIRAHFNAVVTPDDCGVRKPDIRMFQYALEQLGVDATNATMIGDNFESDIEPALVLGMSVFHIRSHEEGGSIGHALGAA